MWRPSASPRLRASPRSAYGARLADLIGLYATTRVSTLSQPYPQRRLEAGAFDLERPAAVLERQLVGVRGLAEVLVAIEIQLDLVERRRQVLGRRRDSTRM